MGRLKLQKSRWEAVILGWGIQATFNKDTSAVPAEDMMIMLTFQPSKWCNIIQFFNGVYKKTSTLNFQTGRKPET